MVIVFDAFFVILSRLWQRSEVFFRVAQKGRPAKSAAKIHPFALVFSEYVEVNFVLGYNRAGLLGDFPCLCR